MTAGRLRLYAAKEEEVYERFPPENRMTDKAKGKKTEETSVWHR